MLVSFRTKQSAHKFYQTSPVLIDYNRLMQGEEGITNYFDIEVIKKNKKMKRREAFIDTIKMPKEAKDMPQVRLALWEKRCASCNLVSDVIDHLKRS